MRYIGGKSLLLDNINGVISSEINGISSVIDLFAGCGGSKEDKSSKAEETVDVDLTALSSTMVYSEVYNMLTAPEDYMGKTIKMNGAFNYYEDTVNNVTYYACVIMDATACCAQGLEFVPQDKYSFPDDFPPDGEEITVTGVFDTYTLDDYTYCTLRNAVIV